jgi:endonuclease YncB( thermonuclease family)
MSHLKRTKKLLRHFMPLAVLCALLCTSAAVRGASLSGKVIEVNSGDVITISNLNRPVRVRLLGVDAPEIDQTFGDVAKKHLADLVYDKSVLVEYAGIAGDRSLNGRVLLDGADIGAQMIRDGAAWVDPSNEQRLSATDREVYAQSERAARNERRGLWQQDNPLAPWEFARAVELKTKPVAALNTVSTVRKHASDRPTPELTSLTLMASRLAAATPAARASSPALPEGFLAPVDGGNWNLLRPAREQFSVLVPEEGDQQPIPLGEGLSNGHVYRGRDGRAAFVVTWLTGPTYGESDVDAIKSGVSGLLKGLGEQSAFSCESLQNEKDISMRGFTGLEFELGSCTVPVKARVFTRIINGDERQVYLALVLYMEKADNVSRFINSFTITEPKPPKGTKSTK